MSRLFQLLTFLIRALNYSNTNQAFRNLCSFEAENLQHLRTTTVSVGPRTIHLTLPTEILNTGS